MNENRRRILDMLAEGKISSDEAERLLALVDPPPTDEPGGPSRIETTASRAKYLRVVVEPGDDDGNGSDQAHGHGHGGGGERVNIRIPMALIRAGMKLHALIPVEAAEGINQRMRDKGINVDLRNLKTEDLEQLIDALSDLEIDVQSREHKVRIFVE